MLTIPKCSASISHLAELLRGSTNVLLGLQTISPRLIPQAHRRRIHPGLPCAKAPTLLHPLSLHHDLQVEGPTSTVRSTNSPLDTHRRHRRPALCTNSLETVYRQERRVREKPWEASYSSGTYGIQQLLSEGFGPCEAYSRL